MITPNVWFSQARLASKNGPYISAGV